MDVMQYVIVIHKDKNSDYGVTVPDLPGCFSAGRTIEEAVASAQEAIELHLEGLIEEGQAIPQPRTIEHHQSNPDYKGGVWALVYIDPSSLRLEAQRVNITMPRRVLEAVDRYVQAHGETRSGFLTQAATAMIGQTSAPAHRAATPSILKRTIRRRKTKTGPQILTIRRSGAASPRKK
jgi:predicted RNase H-like HicB family nuclease